MKKLQKKLYNKKYYSKNKKRFKSYYLKNKKKQLKASAQWKRDNPDKHRGHVYKSSYGITLEQYNKMFKRQNGKMVNVLFAKTTKESLKKDYQ